MRNVSRRYLLRLAAGAALTAASRSVWADGYPTHPVRIVVGFAAGSTSDILARLIGQWLSERLGQQFIVENRPGAGGNVGAETVVKAAPDGYTLLMVPPAVAANAALYKDLNFDFVRDAAPVAGVVRVPNVLEVNPSVPVKTVPELIAYAKANSGVLSFASAGIGTMSHLAGQLFNTATGINLQHVPYRGDGRGVANKIEVEIFVESTIGRHRRRHHEKRITVGRGLNDGFGADIAASARPVLDNELLAKPLRQRLPH